jgi:hypothetical protein
MISARSRSRSASRVARLESCTVSVMALATLSLVGCGGTTVGASGDKGSPVGSDAGTTEDSGRPMGKADAGHVSKPDSAAPPADAAPDVNHGAKSETYPAFPADVARVVDNGGPVLIAPQIVTISWSTDPDAPTWNAFGDAIGPSPYWHAINSEYGVGPATSGEANHISITTASPTEFSDSDLDAFVTAHAGVDWPAPTLNTIYAIYMAPGTGLYFGGSPSDGGQDACELGVGGYHTETQDPNHSVYAIMPHCSFFADADIELSASHEFNEAATDPHPYTALAYAGFDQDHLAFEFFNQFQDELGDACESFIEATDSTDFAPYTTQRQWSNASAAAGSHWCLPALPEAFYNSTFLPDTKLDNINADLTALGYGPQTSQGFKIDVGTSRTFPIGYISDQATAPFTLDVEGLDQPIAQDQNGANIANGTATVTIDKTTGQNGDIAYVTVTPTAYSSLGLTFFYIRAVLPDSMQHHYLPILLSQR